jgi:hypothetical protein
MAKVLCQIKLPGILWNMSTFKSMRIDMAKVYYVVCRLLCQIELPSLIIVLYCTNKCYSDTVYLTVS